MLKKLMLPLFGWQLGTEADYRTSHALYGSSTITHPNILNFIHRDIECDPHYYIKKNADNELLGAFCTWGTDYLAGDSLAARTLPLERYAIARDELILPVSPALRSLMPFKTKSLSSLHADNFYNLSFRFNSGRTICLAKGCDAGGFSTKTTKRRNKELKDFLNKGGEIRDQASWCAEELATLYFDLFEIRRGQRPSDFATLVAMMTALREHFFGHVLLLNGKPCAFQLITMAESPEWISFDYINGGMDTSLHALCLGTIVTWLNVNAAFALCASKGKAMRYSFGKPTAAYKDRWCLRAPLGRLLTL